MKHPEFEVDCLAVVSEDWAEELCEEYNFFYTTIENDPLGRKLNHGLSKAFTLDWDYLMQIGSDDVLSSELLDVYRWNKPCFGISKGYFIDLNTGRAGIKDYQGMVGCGRVIRRAEIEKACISLEVKMNTSLAGPNFVYRAGETYLIPRYIARSYADRNLCEVLSKEIRVSLWADDLNKTLDNNSEFKLVSHGIPCAIYRPEKPMFIDFKSDINIWSFDDIANDMVMIDFPEAIDMLGKEELNLLTELCAPVS